MSKRSFFGKNIHFYQDLVDFGLLQSLNCTTWVAISSTRTLISENILRLFEENVSNPRIFQTIIKYCLITIIIIQSYSPLAVGLQYTFFWVPWSCVQTYKHNESSVKSLKQWIIVLVIGRYTKCKGQTKLRRDLSHLYLAAIFVKDKRSHSTHVIARMENCCISWHGIVFR